MLEFNCNFNQTSAAIMRIIYLFIYLFIYWAAVAQVVNRVVH